LLFIERPLYYLYYFCIIVILDKDQKASGRNVVLKLINIIYQNMSNLPNLFLLIF